MLPHLWWLASPLLPKYEICGTDHLLCLLALYLTFQNCWTSPRSFLLVLVKVFVTVLKGSFHESLETDSSRRACALISCTGCYWFPHLLRHVHWEGSHLFSNCSHEPSFLLSIKTLLSGGGVDVVEEQLLVLRQVTSFAFYSCTSCDESSLASDTLRILMLTKQLMNDIIRGYVLAVCFLFTIWNKDCIWYLPLKKH